MQESSSPSPPRRRRWTTTGNNKKTKKSGRPLSRGCGPRRRQSPTPGQYPGRCSCRRQRAGGAPPGRRRWPVSLDMGDGIDWCSRPKLDVLLLLPSYVLFGASGPVFLVKWRELDGLFNVAAAAALAPVAHLNSNPLQPAFIIDSQCLYFPSYPCSSLFNSQLEGFEFWPLVSCCSLPACLLQLHSQPAAASIGADVIRRGGLIQLNNCGNVRSSETRSELDSEHSKGFKIHFKDFCVFKCSNLSSCNFN